ncbi:MAG: GNAT family N-acetyltransferase [Candidatus Hydrogenedentes bacterium]|nr:GNAT family N-acetyltransferase [Candidatus Hydrogenedentota bacterium]
MEGPRAATAGDLPSIGVLVDTVFNCPSEGWMIDQFPTLFNERNVDNLLVVADGATVVSHVGMVERWASLAGCAVRVACIGAVATYESYRGRGYASQLFARACEKAKAGGVDIMMISGGKGLYRGNGAADVGRDFKARLDIAAARTIADPQAQLRLFADDDLPACAAAYDRKTARYIRGLHDWRDYLRSRAITNGDQRIHVVVRNGATCGYMVHARPNKEGRVDIVEFAGEDTAVAGTAHRILEDTGAQAVQFHLQSGDTVAQACFRAAGVELQPACTLGTLLLINFPQLMRRLAPLFESRAGFEASLDFAEDNGSFVFACGGLRQVVSSKIEAAQRVFGHRDVPAWDGALGGLFPAPTLWYGLNYV